MASLPDTSPNILVVDDESIVVSLIRDTLEDEQFRVRTASDGQSALSALRQQRADLLISDIRMPGMNGIELARVAREFIPDLAVIFVTGYADLNSAKDAIQQGAYDYIMKPFDLEEIRSAVRKALKRRSEDSSRNSESHLTSLSKMSSMLFSAGDVNSLVSSTLRFMMMQQQADQGQALITDREHGELFRVSIDSQKTFESRIPLETVQSALRDLSAETWGETVIIEDCLAHPVGRALESAGLLKSLAPEWRNGDQPVIFVPVARPDRWYGWAVLGYKSNADQIRSANHKYLDIAASQLAISLENLALLRDSQRAYSTLKGLQEQTIELEKMATRGVMSAEIGHEMNNFLAVVAGNLSLLQVNVKKQKFDQIERYVTAINGTVEKMTVFTRNLMDLTPMSSKKVRTSFGALLSEVLVYVRPQKRFRGIDIIAPADFPDLPVDADSIQIQQLLYNLFNNSADAMINSATRRITVSLRVAEDQEHFVFSISDTGSGFEPEVVAKAFQERFTTKPTGHGFGLVVCKRIIENHNGVLDLQSQPGKGATIAITFPICSAKDDTDPEKTDPHRSAKQLATAR